ncbi:MAG: carbon-nitrogen hydrolase family protein [Myxococcota bacterium]
MRIALVQYRRQHPVDVSRVELVGLATAAAVGSDLVVLPEMAVTGYAFAGPDAVRAVAEAPDGPTVASWAAVARGAGCWVVGGFPERDGDRLFNSAAIVDPRGALRFVYRKTLLYEADLPWAAPGDSGYRAFDAEHGRFGVGICMDLNDDGFVGWVNGADLDVIAFPTNWVRDPDDSLDPWTYWAWRIDASGAALAAANTWGVDGGLSFTGRSAILHRRRLLGALGETGNGVVRATVRR